MKTQTKNKTDAAKHTPGPWTAETDNVYNYDGRIAKVCGDTDQQAEANARLIASAPALLEQNAKLREALRELSECAKSYEQSGGSDMMRASWVAQIARAALADL